MRMIVIGLTALSLAGCGQGLVQIDGGNQAGPAMGGGPGRPGGQGGQRPGAPSREGTIAACVQDLSRSLPQGTNVQALCTCTVDRMIAGTGQMDAVRQCATEQNIRLPGQ